jgi:hypothetical protein
MDLHMSPGDREVIPLRALATAGYRWTVSVEGPDPDAIAVELTLGELPPGSPPGRSVPEQAVITARHPGTAIARLEQRRPGEDEGQPASTLEVRVEVTSR